VVERITPVFSCFAADIVHTGAVGSAQVAKAANNLVMWACLIANHEALALAKRYGVDVEKLRKALLMSSAENYVLRNWGENTMAWAEDDMEIVQQMAHEAGIGLPQAVIDIFRQEAGEAFGNRFVHWDQSMFEKQPPNPMPLCRRKARLRQELFLGDHRVVNPMVGGIQDRPHPFDAVQVVNKDVSVHKERCRVPGHLLIPSQVLQERFRGVAIPVSPLIHVREACDGLLLPHPEPPLFGGDGLGEVAVHDILSDPVLFPDVDRRYLPFANEAADRFG